MAEGKVMAPPVRPEFVNAAIAAGDIGEVERPLSGWERISNLAFVRKAFILLLIAGAWELYARFPIGWAPEIPSLIWGAAALAVVVVATLVARWLLKLLPAPIVAVALLVGLSALGGLLWRLGYLVIGAESPLLFPSFSSTIAALFEALVNGPLLS
ncbi:MAG: hypothetical protein F9K44_12865, partial [Hyphomicrobiaceae bacterium]